MRRSGPRSTLLALMLFVAVPASAADDPIDPTQFSWQQKPGAQVPLQTAFAGAGGRPVTLRMVAGAAPIILDLGYFHCPSLCGVARSDLLAALHQSSLRPGQDYTVLAISIDPAETPADAESAQRADSGEFPDLPNAAFHYLTGSAQAVSAVESAVGFRARYDPHFRQFLHPSGLAILTREGVVSSYLLGVGYKAGDLRQAVVRAREGGIARAALPILLLCFHFDASTGRYTLAITKILRLAGLLTVAMIIGLVVVLSRGRAEKESKKGLLF